MKQGRLIVYGDLHGCLEEFKLLRKKIKASEGDIEVALGDIINKGPYSVELIKYLKGHRILSVLGNHEDKFLRYKLNSSAKNRPELSNSQKAVYGLLDDECFTYMQAMPYFLRFGKITLLHGGIINSMNLDMLTKKQAKLLMHIRWLDESQHFVSIEETKNKGKYFWSDVYDGHEGFIVYGHQPFREPKHNEFSLGIDTGCAYGNKLTAAIFKLKGNVVDNLEFKIEQIDSFATYERKNDF